MTSIKGSKALESSLEELMDELSSGSFDGYAAPATAQRSSSGTEATSLTSAAISTSSSESGVMVPRRGRSNPSGSPARGTKEQWYELTSQENHCESHHRLARLPAEALQAGKDRRVEAYLAQ